MGCCSLLRIDGMSIATRACFKSGMTLQILDWSTKATAEATLESGCASFTGPDASEGDIKFKDL